MKKLSEVIPCSYDDIWINGITDDSRFVQKGYLFVATKGFNVDHFDFIPDAIKRGAVAIVCDRECSVDCSIPCIIVSKDIQDVYIECCERFYEVDSSSFSFLGITGTDGKTTTATIIYRLLNSIFPTAYLGTNGLEIDGEIFPTHNTTPCISELYSSFRIAKDHGCKIVSMEASSEALLHKRLNHLQFDIIGYTNITGDHLNVHHTFDQYFQCKMSFLQLLRPNGKVIVNGDDAYCRQIQADHLYRYGFDSYNDYVISDVVEMADSVQFKLVGPDQVYSISSPYVGRYNLYNVTLAFLVCLFYGVDSEILISHLAKLGPISGRREVLDFGQDYEIILDYAHTIHGISEVLDSVPKNKKIITVTGCAGGREKEKRSIIGKIVLEKSDFVIFTMDDPRNEDVNDIIDQMVSNHCGNYLRICDRKEAIYQALSLADSSSVVLILGKGRDNYMAIGDQKVPYCDYDVLVSYFSSSD